jgi:cysteine desulfurase
MHAMNLPIYLDYAATTPVDPRVAEKMLHYLTADGIYANAASTHVLGQAAKQAIDEARQQVAKAIHAGPAEIIWTSGATEANNLALKGAAQLYQRKGRHIVTLKTEHPAVLDTCQYLEKSGFFVSYLTPESNGLLNIEKFQAALRDDTILVSIMAVNNELGVIQDLDAIAKITSAREILLHVDAAQAIGKITIDIQKTPIDLLSMCAHKVYGPKGIGALYVRRKPRVRVAPEIHGGGQEQGMRSGTLPTHQIVGMGEAFLLAINNQSRELIKITALKQRFWQGLSQFLGVELNGDFTHTVPHILNVRFPEIKAEKFMQALPSLALSSGSACHAKGIEPSYVLRAIGLNSEEAHCSVRFSFGRFTTEKEIDFALQEILSFLN